MGLAWFYMIVHGVNLVLHDLHGVSLFLHDLDGFNWVLHGFTWF